MARGLKVSLALVAALWGLAGLFFNLTALGTTYDYVELVASMGWAPDGMVKPPFATASPIVVWSGVILVVLGKAVPLFFCGFGAAIMLRHLRDDALDFQKAKSWAIFGAGGGFALLFLGFAVFGEMTFAMFYDTDLEKAAQAAWRYGGFMGLTALIIGQPD